MSDTQNKAQTPTLAETIRAVMERRLVDLHTCLPAKILIYNPLTQTATVQISLLKKYATGITKPWPPIPGVQVVFPRSTAGAAFMHFPLMPGDDVLLVFSERSLDKWKMATFPVSPQDTRKFDITDAFAIPGGSSLPSSFKPTPGAAVEIVNGASRFLIYPTGQFAIKNPAAELIDLLDKVCGDLTQLLTALSTETAGPFPLSHAAQYATLSIDVIALNLLLKTLKGA